MALTPEDVVNKRFESTKFREGYDQDDVDDFLDEVVVELRRLNQENDELRQRLTAAESRAAEGQQTAANAPAPAALDSAPAPEPAAVAAVAPAPASSALDDTNSTNNLLQLARRLHEEHVREGVQKREALIAEGQAAATEIIAKAETQGREQLGNLEQERDAIEARIESLRSFEREYREKLKSYIEGQLEELDSSSLVSAGQPAAQGSAHESQTPVSEPSETVTPEGFAAPQTAQQPPASFTGFTNS